MLLKVTTKRQVTFPAHVLEALGVRPGDRIELRECEEGYLLLPRRVDESRLAPLRDKLRKGKGTFDLETFRRERHDPSLRD
ncbi:AbrB/MazE/SpoVT family DNA-binding domain-containing protein [Deferrisoma palaeochoriense]